MAGSDVEILAISATDRRPLLDSDDGDWLLRGPGWPGRLGMDPHDVGERVKSGECLSLGHHTPEPLAS